MRARRAPGAYHPTIILWMAVGLVGFALLPWYGLDSNFFKFSWLFDDYPLGDDSAPALFLVLQGPETLARTYGAAAGCSPAFYAVVTRLTRFSVVS